MRRRFNTAERQQLFLRSGGNCEKCDAPLLKSWHADHVIPFSQGGSTVISNAQALCPACNLKKGDKCMKVPDWFSERRRWQEECYGRVLKKWGAGERDFLVEAYPGSGKTAFALWMIMNWLTKNNGSRVVVVAPSDNLRLQWMHEAASFGIHLDNEYNGTYTLASDMHGVVQTYATIANNPLAFQSVVSSGGLAVLDEVHHAGDQLSWGDGLKSAFDTIQHTAFKVLALSGTPFRSDNARIPFVEYINAGNGVLKGRPDYRYGYGEALSDGVVRSIIFPEYEGETTWMDEMGMRSMSFDDKASRDDSSKRLRAALNASPDNEFVCELIRHAHEKLVSIRGEYHPDAGGLIVATDVRHAYDLQNLMYSLVGIRPDVVASKEDGGDPDKEASDRVASFRDGSDPWIIAVNMISEGVDIKRLRVGVYLSNKKTPLFLTQVIGRVIRMLPNIKKQEAFFFFPKEASFVEVISNLQQERDHLIIEDGFDDDDDDGGDIGMSSDGGDMEPVVFVPVSGLYTGHVHEYGGEQYTQGEVDHAAELAKSFGIDADPVKLAAALRKDRGALYTSPATVKVSPDLPKKLVNKRLRSRVNKLVKRLSHLMHNNTEGRKELGWVHGGYAKTHDDKFVYTAVYLYMRQQTGVGKKIAEMTTDELHAAILWATKEVSRWK